MKIIVASVNVFGHRQECTGGNFNHGHGHFYISSAHWRIYRL